MVSGSNPSASPLQTTLRNLFGPHDRLRLRIAIVLILLLATGLRAYELNSRPFWGDEALTGDLALFGPASVLRTTAPFSFLRQWGAQHGGQFVAGWGFQMPLPLLASLTGLIGSQDMLIRLPSFLAGILAVAVAFSLGRRLRSPGVGVLLALLLAVSSFHIQYSQEARYYGLMSFLSLLCAYLLLRGLQENRLSDLVAFTIVAAFDVWNHLFAVFFIAPMVVYALLVIGGRVTRSLRMPNLRLLRRRSLSRRKTMRSRLLSAQQTAASYLRRIPLAYVIFFVGVIVLGLLTLEVTAPVIRAVLTSTRTGGNDIGVVFSTADATRTAQSAPLHGFSLAPASLLGLLALFGSGPGWTNWVYLTFALLGVASLFMRQSLDRRPSSRRPYLFLLLWFWLPLILVSLVRSQHFFAEKYLIFVQPAYLAFVALGIYAVANVALRLLTASQRPRLALAPAVVAALALLLLVINTQPVLAYYGQQDRLDWRAVIAHLQTDLHTDDAVVFSTTREQDWGPFIYYFRRMVPPETFGSFVQTFGDLTATQLQSVFDSHKRIWIVDHARNGGFKEIGAILPFHKPEVVADVNVYLIPTTPILTSQVPFDWPAGAAQLRINRAALTGRELLVGLLPNNEIASQRYDLYVNGHAGGNLDPAGVQMPNFARIPFTSTSTIELDIVPSQPPTSPLSGTLTLAYAPALPAQAGERLEAELYPTENGYIFQQDDASDGAFVRAQGFGVIAQYQIWAAEPGDYQLTLGGRMSARIGLPKWSVVLDRKAIGVLTTPISTGAGSGWQTASIPLNFSETGLHILTLGITADAYFEQAVADLDYIMLEARQNWVYRGVNQISLGNPAEPVAAFPISAANVLTSCLVSSNDDTGANVNPGVPARWLTSEPVTFTVSVANAADYVLSVVASSVGVTQPVQVSLNDRFLGQLDLAKSGAGLGVQPVADGGFSYDFLTHLDVGEYEILLTPPPVELGQLCLRAISFQLVYPQPADGERRVPANPFIVGDKARLQTMNNRPTAIAAGTGEVIRAALWFTDTANYMLHVSALNDRPAPVQIRAELDGKPLEQTFDFARNDYTWSERSVRMPVSRPGLHTLSLIFTNDLYDSELVASKSDGDRNAMVDSFAIATLSAPVMSVGNQATIALANDDDLLPPGASIAEVDGVRAVMRPAAGPVASLDLNFATAGGYQLTVRAQNDQPGPVELAAFFDGAPIGLLIFDANDHSWSEQSLLFPVGLPGYHRLTLEFTADAYDQALIDAGQDGDRNALIETVTLTKIPAAISRNNALIELNFDDLLNTSAANQPRLERIDGAFAFVFTPGAELTFPLIFLSDGNFVLEASGRGARLGNNLQITLDDSLLDNLSFDLQTDSRFIGMQRQPDQTGTVIMRLRNTSQRELYLQTLRIFGNLLYADPALAWTPAQGGLDEGVQIVQEGEHSAAMRPGAGRIVTLNVLLPKAGVYRLSVVGQNDRPGPVILDVQLNDVQLGQIFFNEDDGSWSTRTLQIVADRPGIQLLSIFFNNDAYQQDLVAQGLDGDRNALIERISLAPLSAAR